MRIGRWRIRSKGIWLAVVGILALATSQTLEQSHGDAQRLGAYIGCGALAMALVAGGASVGRRQSPKRLVVLALWAAAVMAAALIGSASIAGSASCSGTSDCDNGYAVGAPFLIAALWVPTVAFVFTGRLVAAAFERCPRSQ